MTLPAPIAEAVARFRAALRERFGDRLRELVLFGSQARGEATEESDVDLLVVVEGLTEAERREVLDLGWAAGAAGSEYVCLAPLPYSSDQIAELRRRERRLPREIERDGIPL